MGADYVFVGGTGRSGTTIVSKVLGRTDELHLITDEVRYHVDKGGLTDLANGETGIANFRERLLGPWFERETPMGPRGISQHTDRDVLAAAIDTCADRWQGDPRTLAAQIWRTTIATIFGEVRVVESTPPNVMHADRLERMLGGEMAMIDVVRDGRDVAHSLARMKWGPGDPVTALYWWANRVREANKARRICSRPPLVIRFEEVVDPDGHANWSRQLAGHIGDVDPDGILAGFEKHFEPSSAHVGTWRADAGADHESRIDALYRRLYSELVDEGADALPPTPR